MTHVFIWLLQSGSPVGAVTTFPLQTAESPVPSTLPDIVLIKNSRWSGCHFQELKILKLTFYDLLRRCSSLATIVVVGFSTKCSLCYLPALSLTFLFYKMRMRNLPICWGWENKGGIAYWVPSPSPAHCKQCSGDRFSFELGVPNFQSSTWLMTMHLWHCQSRVYGQSHWAIVHRK